MLYFITQSYIFISNDPWVIVIRLKAKEYFLTAAVLIHCYIAFPQKYKFFPVFYSVCLIRTYDCVLFRFNRQDRASTILLLLIEGNLICDF